MPPEQDRAWSVQTVQHVRTLPAVKAVDPFVQLHLKREARLAGHDDALPSSGVARVMRAAELPVERRALPRDELAGVRLLVASNTVVVATALARVDEQDICVDLDLLAVLRRRSHEARGVRLTG